MEDFVTTEIMLQKTEKSKIDALFLQEYTN